MLLERDFFPLFSYPLSFHFQGMIKNCFIMNSNIHDNEFLLLQFIEFIINIRWCSSIIIYYSFLYCIEIYDLRSFIHSNQTYFCYLFSIYDFNRIFSWTQSVLNAHCSCLSFIMKIDFSINTLLRIVYWKCQTKIR